MLSYSNSHVGKQPTGPAELIDLDNGARWSGAFNFGLGPNGGTNSTTPTGVAYSAGPAGLAVKTAGDSSSYLTLHDTRLAVTGPLTLVCTFSIEAIPSNRVIASCSSDSPDWYDSPFLFGVTSSGKIYLGRAGGIATERAWMESTYSSIQTKTIYTVVAASNSFTVSQHADASNVAFFVNGIKYSSSVNYAEAGTGAITATSAETRIGGSKSNPTAEPSESNVFFLGVISGMVSDNLARRLSRGIGAAYKTRRVVIPAAASSLPTLSSATWVPGSLTSSGFRPRVTATY